MVSENVENGVNVRIPCLANRPRKASTAERGAPMKNSTPMIPSAERDGDVPILGLRPVDAARAIGVSPRKLWEITADRGSGIPHCRFGKAIVYPIRELEDWLAKRSATNMNGVPRGGT